MKRQDRAVGEDYWMRLLERSLPWVAGGLLVGLVVLWLLAAILGAPWARF